ncbi:MAG: Rid family detoxifying hydrolase [Nanoarchaeota archaeon]
MKKIIKSKKAPEAKGPYSHAILHDHKYTMELSGQIGINPKTGKLTEGIVMQTEQTFANINSILEEVGWDTNNLVKVRVLLADMKDYGIVNEVYSTFFPGNFPARVAVAVKELPLGALIEIDCTAAGDKINN